MADKVKLDTDRLMETYSIEGRSGDTHITRVPACNNRTERQQRKTI